MSSPTGVEKTTVKYESICVVYVKSGNFFFFITKAFFCSRHSQTMSIHIILNQAKKKPNLLTDYRDPPLCLYFLQPIELFLDNYVYWYTVPYIKDTQPKI